MTFAFLKMHGAANDFVVIDHREPFLPADMGGLVRRLCDRRRGVGADGVLLIEHDDDCDFEMRYFNADGRTVPYCGNGARCVARLAFDLGLGQGGRLRFRSGAGIQSAREEDGRIAIEFGNVAQPAGPLSVEAAGRSFSGLLVQAGVPHFVVEVERVEGVPVGDWGVALRRHARFAPGGTNVDFVARLGGGRVAMRTYERGVEAETLACGSGAIACSVWAVLAGDRPPILVQTMGGDELEVGLEPLSSGGWNATLTGPVEVAYAGEWTEPGIEVEPAAERAGAHDA